MRNKSKNNITLYIVTPNLSDDVSNIRNSKILYISEDKAAADEFIIKKLIQENREHFSLWCINHSYDEMDSKYWLKYMRDVLTKENLIKYNITKAIYTPSSIAEIFRYYTNCEDLL